MGWATVIGAALGAVESNEKSRNQQALAQAEATKTALSPMLGTGPGETVGAGPASWLGAAKGGLAGYDSDTKNNTMFGKSDAVKPQLFSQDNMISLADQADPSISAQDYDEGSREYALGYGKTVSRGGPR